MISGTNKRRVCFARNNAEDILHSTHWSAASNVQVADADMAAQIAIIRVQKLWSTEPAITVQKTTNPPVTEQHADDIPVSEKDDML